MTNLVRNSPLPSTHLRNRILRPFTIAAAIYIIASGFRFMLVSGFSEWDKVFVLAAKQLLAGHDIYTLLPQQFNHLYSYPPFSALFAVPFSWLNWRLARFIFFLVNVAALIFLWRASWTVSGGSKIDGLEKPKWPETIVCILGLACAMRFVEDGLEHQQIDLIIGALLIGGCLTWQRGRAMLTATLWGIAAAFKGPPLLLAGYLLWRGRWYAAIWMAALMLGLNLLPDLVHRPASGIWLSQWYTEIVKPAHEAGLWYSDVNLNQSLAGAVFRYLCTGWTISNGQFATHAAPRISLNAMKLILYASELAMTLATAIVLGRPFRRGNPDSRPDVRRWRDALECSVCLIVVLMLSPMSSKPHFCVLLLPAYCAARLAVIERRWWGWAGVCACIVLVVLLDRNIIHRAPGQLLMWLGSVMWGAIALWLVCLIGIARLLSGQKKT